MKELTKEDFENTVADGNHIVDFWAPWCGPCRILGPNLEAASNETDKTDFAKINVDEQPDIASKYGVRSIPTLIFFKDGEPVERAIGAMSKDKILDLINQVYS